MASSAKDLLKEFVLKDPTVCSRCLAEARPSSAQKDHHAGAVCGESCGNLGISMESDPVSTKTMLARGENLLDILGAEQIDINPEKFRAGIEEEAVTNPPREVLRQAIEYGRETRTLPKSDGKNTENDIDGRESSLGGFHSRRRSLPEIVAEEPITTSDLKNHTTDQSLQNHLSEFEVPSSEENVFYLENTQAFVDNFDVDNVSSYPDSAVSARAVSLCWHNLMNGSPRVIDEWIEEMDERFSQYVLSEAVLRGPRPITGSPFKGPKDSFRNTSFWPLVKEREVQPITSYMKRQGKPVSPKQIAQSLNKKEVFVQKLLGILKENGTVTVGEEGWQYVKPEGRGFEKPDN